jgi:hypothetical protein
MNTGKRTSQDAVTEEKGIELYFNGRITAFQVVVCVEEQLKENRKEYSIGV